MPGPAKQPTALLLLNGNPGKRPINRHEPQPRPGAPSAPAWLDAIAQEQWDTLAPRLERLGVLTHADGEALANLCNAFSQARQASTSALALRWWQFYLRLLHEFGLTPSSRTSLAVRDGAQHDDFFGDPHIAQPSVGDQRADRDP